MKTESGVDDTVVDRSSAEKFEAKKMASGFFPTVTMETERRLIDI